MKSILVTGGAGYIGSHTIVELLNNNYNVVVIDNLSNSTDKVFLKIKEITGKGVIFYKRDCRDNIDDIILDNNIDSIIHFAAHKSVSESFVNPIEYYDNNVNSLLNVLNTSIRLGVESLIFSSSCSVYGDINHSPVSETSNINPKSPYASSKHICEEILSNVSTSNTSDIKIASLRYFNPAGYHKSGLLNLDYYKGGFNIFDTIYNCHINSCDFNIFGTDYNTIDGSCIRDYIHISDLSIAHIKALEYISNSNDNYQVFNIGSECGYSIFDVIKSFNKTFNTNLIYKSIGRRIGDIESIYADSTKFKLITNWEPNKNIDDIFKSYLKLI